MVQTDDTIISVLVTILYRRKPGRTPSTLFPWLPYLDIGKKSLLPRKLPTFIEKIVKRSNVADLCDYINKDVILMCITRRTRQQWLPYYNGRKTEKLTSSIRQIGKRQRKGTLSLTCESSSNLDYELNNDPLEL